MQLLFEKSKCFSVLCIVSIKHTVPQWKTIIHFHYSRSSKKKLKYFLKPFQYSERTKATTETNNTSKERSDYQRLGARQIKVWHYKGGITPTSYKKHISFFAVMKREDAQ